MSRIKENDEVVNACMEALAVNAKVTIDPEQEVIVELGMIISLLGDISKSLACIASNSEGGSDGPEGS
jgi:predicted nucleotide-binding protein